MIPPKTDWTYSDYYNLTDHVRIGENLNDPIVRGGMPETIGLGPGWKSVGNELYYSDKLLIAEHYNTLATNMGLGGFPQLALTYNWFNWIELNLLEGLPAEIQRRYPEYARYGNGTIYGSGNTLGGGFFG